ncbi:MAG: hypothetical protein HC817_02275 [Saprospiraceae bacterium]|nr:hypothetical protein [Saprospiraceae bacterium]
MRQTTNILLIEDNPGDAQLVKIYMKDAAFKYELFVADTFLKVQIFLINKKLILFYSTYRCLTQRALKH